MTFCQVGCILYVCIFRVMGTNLALRARNVTLTVIHMIDQIKPTIIKFKARFGGLYSSIWFGVGCTRLRMRNKGVTDQGRGGWESNQPPRHSELSAHPLPSILRERLLKRRGTCIDARIRTLQIPPALYCPPNRGTTLRRAVFSRCCASRGIIH